MLIENPKFLSDVKLIKKDLEQSYENDGYDEEVNKELTVHKIFQSFDIQIGHDVLYNKNFVFKPNEKDVVIEKDFIFALINVEVLTDLNIPSVSLNVITQNDWKKC